MCKNLFKWIIFLSLVSFSTLPMSANAEMATIGVVMVEDANGDGLPNFGDTIGYQVNSPQPPDHITTVCLQNGSGVFISQIDFPFDAVFPLAGPAWSGGGADCNAQGYRLKHNGDPRAVKIFLNFSVNP